jgi:hypothetical protein
MFAQESVMEIQKIPTLAEKQEFWAEQLPNFKAKYWLPSHFKFVAFDMEQGNFDIKDGLDPSFEDDAVEIWHRVNTGWAMWKKAINFGRKQPQAVPEGFVLVPKENISCYWQDNDEPENFCSNESDFDCLGDCIDLGEIMEINKFTQAHVNKEILFGTWFAEAIDPSEKANFFVGTHAECLEIVAKNKAMIEAQEQSHE